MFIINQSQLLPSNPITNARSFDAKVWFSLVFFFFFFVSIRKIFPQQQTNPLDLKYDRRLFHPLIRKKKINSPALFASR